MPGITLAPLHVVTLAPWIVGDRLLFLLPNWQDSFADGNLDEWTYNGGLWYLSGSALVGDSPAGDIWDMTNIYTADFTYQGVLKLTGGSAMGLVFRGSDDGTQSYDAMLDINEGVFKIARRVPYTILASAPVDIQYNTPYTISVEAIGSDIAGYLNGEQLLTVSDTTFTGGYLGVIVYNGQAEFSSLREWNK